MRFGSKTLYCAAGLFCAGVLVLLSLDTVVSRVEVTATVRAKFLHPPLTGELQRPVIAIEANSQLNTTSLTLASGRDGESNATDIERWKLLREGCRYRFKVQTRTVNGRERSEITGAKMLNCS